jgi:hypothetical protein
MRRGGGIIPPGKAGLIVLAAAMVPIAINKFPKFFRWLGKKIENTGARVQGTVDEVERYERERKAREAAAKVEPPSKRPGAKAANDPQPSEKPRVSTARPGTVTESQAPKPKGSAVGAAKQQGSIKPKSGGASSPSTVRRSRKKASGGGGARKT